MSWTEAMRMPWGVTRMLFESRAEAYDAAGEKADDARYATPADYSNWI